MWKRKFKNITIIVTEKDGVFPIKFFRDGQEILCPLGFIVNDFCERETVPKNSPLGYVYVSVNDIGQAKVTFHCNEEGKQLYNILLELAKEIDLNYLSGYGGDSWGAWIDDMYKIAPYVLEWTYFS